MGLLRKAVQASPLVATVEPEERTRGGLLRRSLEAREELTEAARPALLQPEPDLPPPAPVAAPERIEEAARIPTATEVGSRIQAAIQALPDGVELPAQLFTILARHLAIGKGALLLYDPLRLVYAPWASCGFDQTTLHRLRIPLGANDSFNALANGNPLAVSGADQLARYQGFFSSREFASLARLVLAPLIAEEKLIGVILAADLAPPFEGESALLSCLAEAMKVAGPAVQKARGEKMKSAASPGTALRAAPEEEVARFIAAAGPGASRFLFVGISLEHYSRSVLSAHPHLEPFRLAEDLRYFLGTFVVDRGVAVPLGSGRFLLGLQDIEARDLDLFLHQLGSFLSMLFGGTDGLGPAGGPASVKTRTWPDDGSDIRELVTFLSS